MKGIFRWGKTVPVTWSDEKLILLYCPGRGSNSWPPAHRSFKHDQGVLRHNHSATAAVVLCMLEQWAMYYQRSFRPSWSVFAEHYITPQPELSNFVTSFSLWSSYPRTRMEISSTIMFNPVFKCIELVAFKHMLVLELCHSPFFFTQTSAFITVLL